MFFLIVGLSFISMSWFLSTVVGQYLFEDKLASERTGLEALALRLAPSLRDGDMEQTGAMLEEYAAPLNGRLMLTDAEGAVQLDTRHESVGMRLERSVVRRILTEGRSVDYAVYESKTGTALDFSRILTVSRSREDWDSWCAAAVVSDAQVLGCVVMVTPADTLMRTLYQLQDRTILIFGVIAVISLLFSFVFARVITRPLQELNRGIRHMARGEFSSRVPVRGSREMRQLAEAFNSMSGRLEILDQSRNQFVSNASHELKTPLATMKIMIESLIYQPEMDRNLRTEFLTDIDREIDRLSAVVSDLLTLVKMDSGDVKLNLESLSLAQICRETEHRLLPIVTKKKQTLALTVQDPCDMAGDRSKLTQVVYNLVENAVKYTQEGGKITIALRRDGHTGILAVSDNGPGIARENLPHLFDRFYRVDKARSRESGGTGLGLSIVRQLVLLHDGSIRVESEEGSGTSFIVELPLQRG